jgi:hypothetical protein
MNKVTLLHQQRYSKSFINKFDAQANEPFPSFMYLFLGVVAASSTLVSIGYTIYILGVIRAIRVVHRLLIDSVLHATLRQGHKLGYA